MFIESVQLITEEPPEPIKVKVDHDDNAEAHHRQMVEHLTYLLLKHGVSMEFYHEVAMSFKDLPRSYKVKRHTKIVSAVHYCTSPYTSTHHNICNFPLQLKRFKKSIEVPNIMKTPGPYDGAQFDFKDILIKFAKLEVSV